MQFKKAVCILASVLLLATTASAQVGIFDTNEDIGNTDEVLGAASFSDDIYSLDVLTSDLDEPAPDNFHYAYSEMTGSFIIEANPIVFGGQGGVMVRNNNGDSAAHASLLMTPDLNVWPHTRFADGGGTITDGDPDDDVTETVRLIRAGGSVHYYRVTFDGELEWLQSEVIQFTGDSVLAGLAVGDTNAIAEFENVSVTELPLNVMRTLPTIDYQAGMTMTGVEIAATALEGSSATAVVTEVAPEGSTLSNIQVSAGEFTTEGNTIEWNVGEVSGEATLTYDITFPNREVVTFNGTFEGTEIPLASYIGGPSVLPNTLPEFEAASEPVVVDNLFPTLFQVERGTPGTLSGDELGDVDPDAFGLGLDPRTSGVTVIDTVGSANHMIAIDIDIPETATWYFFGLIREEDGNSDSWHFEINDFPSGDDFSRWNISSEKEYAVNYVSQEEPDNDPRPFELDEGVHTIYLANREDSASIDWLVATKNPSLDLEQFDPNIDVIAGRTLEDNFLERDETETSVEVRIVYRNIDTPISVQEMPPSGFPVSNINASAGEATQDENGIINWDISGLANQELFLTYTLSAPEPEGNTFITGTLDGNILIDGEVAQPVNADDQAIFVEGNAVEPTGQVAFYFQNVPAGDFQDNVMESHLRNQFGLEVQEIDDDDEPGFERPIDLNGADMALVSGSVGSGAIAEMNYHLNAPESLITHESFLYDDYAFTDDFDFTDSVDIEIVDNQHPITEGLELGPLTISHEPDGISWADNPPEGVRILATPPGEPNHASVWVIEPGTNIDGVNIPGIRMGLWTGDFTNLTNQGIDLMNRIIAYALGVDAPEPPTHVQDYMLYE